MKITLDYCDSLAQKYIKKYKLQGFVNNIDFHYDTLPDNTMGKYVNNTICLNIDKTTKYITDLLNRKGYKTYSEDEYNYTIYWYFMETMYHELEHAHQLQLLYNDDTSDFIKSIIYVSNKIIRKNIEQYRYDSIYHNCIPIEHSASSYAAYNTALVIEKLGHLNSSSIVDNLAYGYRLDNRHLISPIEQTMVNLNDNDFTSSDFYPSFCNDIYNNDLTELTKMMYGLPIDTKSFIKINYSNMLSTPAIKIKEYINDK